MAGIKELSEIWKNIQEFDLRPIREAALQPLRIAIAGHSGSGRHALADAMRQDLASLKEVTQTPVMILTLEECATLPDVDLLLVITLPMQENLTAAQILSRRCTDAGLKYLLVCNVSSNEKVLGSQEKSSLEKQPVFSMLVGDVQDKSFLLKQFTPKVLSLVPENHHLSLGRLFPLFRTTIARALIDDACLANAAYSFSTGLAEAIPVLTIPFNVTDMIVITKSQAFLAFKLGLLLGFSTRWQDYVTEFGSVIGGSFVWRQLARQLVGLIPGWGIVPKIAVAYSGTYVVGHTVLQWYLAGRHIQKQQIQSLYQRAIIEGKIIAFRLIEKAPRLKFKPKEKALPASTDESPLPAKVKRSRIGWRRKVALPEKVCANCEKKNAPEAFYCQFCGQTLPA